MRVPVTHTKPTRGQLVPIRFGEYLVENHHISSEALLASLAHHWSSGGRVGDAIEVLGYLGRAELERAASSYHNLSVVELDLPS